jgi:hypothetical protein
MLAEGVFAGDECGRRLDIGAEPTRLARRMEKIG